MQNVSGLNSVQQPVVSFKKQQNPYYPQTGMPMSNDSYQRMAAMERAQTQERRDKARTAASIITAAAFATWAVVSLLKHKYEKNMLIEQTKYFKEAREKTSGEGKSKEIAEKAKQLYEQFKDLSKDEKIVSKDNASIDEGFREFINNVKLSADAPKEIIESVGDEATSNMIIITGRSGYGKTYDADVLAKELGAVRIKRQFSSFSSKYVGETAVNVTNEFNAIEKLLKEHPDQRFCYVLDEADSLFTPLEQIPEHSPGLKETRSAILNAIDQVRGYPNFFMVATTNAEIEKGMIDEAVQRRFAFNYKIKNPNVEALRASHKTHLRGVKGIDDLLNSPGFTEYLTKLYDKGAGHGDVENLTKSVKTRRKAKLVELGKEAGCIDKTTGKCTDHEALKQLIDANPPTIDDFNTALEKIGKLAIETRQPRK